MVDYLQQLRVVHLGRELVLDRMEAAFLGLLSFSKVLSGKVVAEGILDAVKEHTSRLAKIGVRPGLAVVIVGEEPASQVYVTSKGKKAEECGFHTVKHELAAKVTD
ncbi:tetrahydrofolate dehydrogenase/cyclohydrolase catalytic domain-containing protein, partial [Rhizobium ruizarguesonis]